MSTQTPASDSHAAPSLGRGRVLLECHGITRHAGRRRLVDDVSLQLEQGQVTGLLGVNGAGKTTTMEMLTGVLELHGGRVRVCGFDLDRQARAAKRHVGYLPERAPLYMELTCREYLTFTARLRDVPASAQAGRVDAVIERCGLGDFQHRLLGKLSRGMQQRVGIAQAIVHEPAVLVLDEPTAGLDPLQMQEFRKLIRELAGERAVILSTHMLTEVTALCHQAVILHDGRIVYQGGLDEAQGRRLTLRVARPPRDSSVFDSLDAVAMAERHGDREFVFDIKESQYAADAIAALVLEHDLGLISLAPAEGELTRKFTELTGDVGTAA